MILKQEICGRHPLGCKLLPEGDGNSVLIQTMNNYFARKIGVVFKNVECFDGIRFSSNVFAVAPTRLDQPVHNGNEKGTGATCGLHDRLGAQIFVGTVPNEVENEVYDPTPREHLAMIGLFGAFVGGRVFDRKQRKLRMRRLHSTQFLQAISA